MRVWTWENGQKIRADQISYAETDQDNNSGHEKNHHDTVKLIKLSFSKPTNVSSWSSKKFKDNIIQAQSEFKEQII